MIAVAGALYLFDCVALLERGQALWSRGVLSFGSRHYQVRGKTVAVLNPFTPFIPVFRTSPLFSAPAGVRLSGALKAVMPLAVPAFLQFALLFAALPYTLVRAPGAPFLIALALAYLNALLMLGIVSWRFGKAGLPRRPLVALGFGWLACLPLSVNALRKAGLAFEVAMDARRAIRTLESGRKSDARLALAAQIAELIQELDEGDERQRRLAEFHRQLSPEADHGRL